jgi:hypothetical protein
MTDARAEARRDIRMRMRWRGFIVEVGCVMVVGVDVV